MPSPTSVHLRLAVETDAESVFNWRNAESTRRYFLDSRPLTLEAHLSWFRRVLINPAQILLIGETADHQPIGVLRYDLTPEGLAEVSIYVVPDQCGKGYGGALLLAGERWLREAHPDVIAVEASVLSENIGSRKAFEKSGYSAALIRYRKSLDRAGGAAL